MTYEIVSSRGNFKHRFYFAHRSTWLISSSLSLHSMHNFCNTYLLLDTNGDKKSKASKSELMVFFDLCKRQSKTNSNNASSSNLTADLISEKYKTNFIDSAG